MSDHLAPEKAVEVVPNAARNHSVGDVEVRKTVVIEVPGVAGPGPAAHRRSRFGADICKTSSHVLKKAIAHGVFSIESAHCFIVVTAKIVLLGDANARRGPHIGNVKVFASVIVEIKP